MRTGVWLVGARGSVATTTVVGTAALGARLAAPLGCVTETSHFDAAALPAVTDLVFGGHDPATVGLRKRAEQLAAAGVIPASLPDLVGDVLDATEDNLRPGITGDETVGEAVQLDWLIADLVEFRQRHDLAHIVVINVATAEQGVSPHPATSSLDALHAELRGGTGRRVLPVSSRYAYAALRAGCAYVDFTASTGARLPALDELARRCGLPYAGNDGKTGETLLKSVLAPMFAARALRVLSWSGTNLLGGGDGAALADPARAAARRASKDRVTTESLGYPVGGASGTHHVAELGEWKTAWDHIQFAGFLGVPMNLQFTWTGCESALAAPLVIDLARLAGRALQLGLVGPLEPLAFFFKDPAGLAPAGLAEQYATLCAWAAGTLAEEPR